MKIYVASSWRNKYQPEIVDLLRANGHEVYDFRNPYSGGPTPITGTKGGGFSWLQTGIDFKEGDTFKKYKEMLEHPIAQRCFQSDFGAMKWADICVLVLPSGRSAHIEAGWLSGQNKKLVVYHPPAEEWNFEPELMYLVGGEADEVIVTKHTELLERVGK